MSIPEKRLSLSGIFFAKLWDPRLRGDARFWIYNILVVDNGRHVRHIAVKLFYRSVSARIFMTVIYKKICKETDLQTLVK